MAPDVEVEELVEGEGGDVPFLVAFGGGEVGEEGVEGGFLGPVVVGFL